MSLADPDHKEDVDHASKWGRGEDRASTAWTLVAIVILGFLLWSVLAPAPWGWHKKPRQAVMIDNTTYQVNAGEWKDARSRAIRAMTEAEVEALMALEAELEENTQALFALPREQVSAAADWYYSVKGNIIRAGSTLGMDLSGRLIEQMFPPESWSKGQAKLGAELTASAEGHLSRSGEVVLTTFHRELQERRSTAPAQAEVPVFQFDFSQHQFLQHLQNDPALERQGLMLFTSTISALAAKRAAQATAARAATRMGSAKVATVCASTGPAAWFCVTAVFGVTLVSTELTMIHLDEIQNREEFEAALHRDIDRIQAEFETALRETYAGALSREFDRRQKAIESDLRPIDLLFTLRNPEE